MLIYIAIYLGECSWEPHPLFKRRPCLTSDIQLFQTHFKHIPQIIY